MRLLLQFLLAWLAGSVLAAIVITISTFLARRRLFKPETPPDPYRNPRLELSVRDVKARRRELRQSIGQGVGLPKHLQDELDRKL